MNMEIKALEKFIEILFDQYECKVCGKKSYINLDDKQREFVNCLLCGSEAKNTRVFQMEIKGIGDY